MTIPDDFTANWHKMTRNDLATHYGVGVKTITEMCRQLGLRRGSAKVHKSLRSMPDGFAEAAHMTESQLCTRFGCGKSAVKRWRGELGIDGNAQRSARHTPVAPTIKDPRVSIAAKYLQRTRPVYRCNEAGGFGGTTHWRCGREVMTDAALVAKAVAMGWDADEWRRVA